MANSAHDDKTSRAIQICALDAVAAMLLRQGFNDSSRYVTEAARELERNDASRSADQPSLPPGDGAAMMEALKPLSPEAGAAFGAAVDLGRELSGPAVVAPSSSQTAKDLRALSHCLAGADDRELLQHAADMLEVARSAIRPSEEEIRRIERQCLAESKAELALVEAVRAECAKFNFPDEDRPELHAALVAYDAATEQGAKP
jgi:hypothetical protein